MQKLKAPVKVAPEKRLAFCVEFVWITGRSSGYLAPVLTSEMRRLCMQPATFHHLLLPVAAGGFHLENQLWVKRHEFLNLYTRET